MVARADRRALHAEVVDVLSEDDDRQELAVWPVTRWEQVRLLTADAAHDRLVQVTEWCGTRRLHRVVDVTVNWEIRLARRLHRVVDVTVNWEIRLARYMYGRGPAVRVAITKDQAALLDRDFENEDAWT